MIRISEKDTEILRRLGAEYMTFATLPVQKQKMELWKALNRSQMQGPMVAIGQIPFEELQLSYPEELTPVVENRYFRKLEENLRRQIFQWKHFPADMVLEPFIRLPTTARMTDCGLQSEIAKLKREDRPSVASQHFTSVLSDMSDVQKIVDRHIMFDPAVEEETVLAAQKIFGGIAEVRRSHGFTFHLGIWDKLEGFLGGPENAMYLFYDDPDFLHAALTRLTESLENAIDEANKLQLVDDVTPIVHCSYVFNDETLPDFDKGKGSTSENSWAFGLAQIFTSVSPEFMEEFELPYITRLASKFGNLYYGCCDRLDDRLDCVVKKIPNVRKVSCSPWSDRRNFAERIGKTLVMSNKPTPALLAEFDEDAIRRDLTYTCQLAKENGVNLEMILKDISTVCGHPERLDIWNRIAMEIVENY